MDRPVGIFDSGLGGLTCVREFIRVAPGENIEFFGDTARLPYGSKAKDTIINYALQDISFLLDKNVKMIIAACGTVSSNLPEEISQKIGVPFVGIVDPTTEAALKATKNGRIGILGTAATIGSGSFEKMLKKKDPSVTVYPKACPMFVPLVENGYVGRECETTIKIAKEYLLPLVNSGIDTLILGCTHYPLLSDIISDIMGRNVTLIDSGRETALCAAGMTESGGGNEHGTVHFTVSDNADGFASMAGRFLGSDIGDRVSVVNLDGTVPAEHLRSYYVK